MTVLPPIRDKQVQPTLRHRPPRSPYKLLAVRAEHWEAVKLGIVGYGFQTGPIRIYQIQFEVAAPRIFVVRREDDSLVIRSEKWTEVGPADVGNLTLVGA